MRRMLTIFSTPKPFKGHSDVIQRNALQSWKRLHPALEIILIGDESGTAEVCREFGLRHVPKVERTAEGTKLIPSIFGRAQQLASYNIMCYSNCDIILGGDFFRAFQQVSSCSDRFLMIGRRWDANITERINFEDLRWEENLWKLAKEKGTRRHYDAIDYFVFPKGLFSEIPPLAIGRLHWDHWLTWRAADQKASVVDVSNSVIAVHQNHDYSYHKAGEQGVWEGEGTRRNLEIAGGFWHLHTIEDATHRLTIMGLRRRRLHKLAPLSRILRRAKEKVCLYAWHPILDATRSVRHAIGLRQGTPFLWKKRRGRRQLH
jgi:hypothetical protein